MKVLLLFLLLAAGAAGYWFWPWSGEVESATVDRETWYAVTPQHRDLSSSVLATGIVRPSVGAEVAVGSRVSGVLAQLHCDIGSRVEAGQLLAELDPTELDAVRSQAAAEAKIARAERDYAKLVLDRKRGLGGDIVSADEVEVAERAFRVADAQVERAAALLQSAEIQLGFTRIVSPISGVVASVSTQVGETVAASFSAPTFVTIIDLERLEVWAYVDETDIGRIAIGQDVTFTVDTYSSVDFIGRITAVRPKAEVLDNVVNYVAIVEILDRRGKMLRPEMTATLRIELEGGRDAFCVPSHAVRTDAEGAYVLLRH
ncbi:MAG: efflux RND transporter periplasmic adaptor subunit, partial [Planctomycetes bacterium]|nr:efflux RND transporter periplasmic adaptor subunit [Planctomycetota bacterium]